MTDTACNHLANNQGERQAPGTSTGASAEDTLQKDWEAAAQNFRSLKLHMLFSGSVQGPVLIMAAAAAICILAEHSKAD